MMKEVFIPHSTPLSEYHQICRVIRKLKYGVTKLNFLASPPFHSTALSYPETSKIKLLIKALLTVPSGGGWKWYVGPDFLITLPLV